MDINRIRSEILKHADIAENIRTCLRKGVACGLLSIDQDGTEYCRWFFNGPIGRDSTLCSNEVGNCGCIHAEFRAVETAIRWFFSCFSCGNKSSLLVNYSPCTSCANLIAISKCIDCVYYITVTEHDKRGLKHLKRAGIEAIQV